MKIKKIKAILFMKGHSERVPRKNMRSFCGKPLFFWILECLVNSKMISEIIINTDSQEIADLAEKNFNVTIHMRPDYLLNLKSNEAFQIMNYDIKKTSGDFFIQTHSTNPLLKPKTIQKAIKSYFDNLDQFDSLFSVTELQTRLYNSSYEPINHDPNKLIKTQDLDKIYEENSCIYIFSRNSFFKNKNRIGFNPILFPIDPLEAVDIDEEFDFINAESIAKIIK